MTTIFVDTDMDVTPELAKEFGFKLISMPYTIEGVEVKPYIDFETFEAKAFYDRLRKGVVPTTSALSPVDYINYFEPEFAAGNDIFYIHFSSAMSGTFNALRLAEIDLKEKYPDRKITLLDTKAITIGSLALILELGKMHKEGKTVEELIAYANEHIDKVACYFYAEDLKFFGKSGRVSGFAAFMGNIIGIKPIIFIDQDGVMKAKTKCRGHKQTVARLLEFVDELQEDITEHPVVIGHTDSLKVAEEIKEKLIVKYGDKLNVVVQMVNPTAGSHCGPEGVGIAFHAKNR